MLSVGVNAFTKRSFSVNKKAPAWICYGANLKSNIHSILYGCILLWWCSVASKDEPALKRTAEHLSLIRFTMFTLAWNGRKMWPTIRKFTHNLDQFCFDVFSLSKFWSDLSVPFNIEVWFLCWKQIQQIENDCWASVGGCGSCKNTN